MPELPDVEIYKRYLDAKSLHKKIKKIDVTSTEILEGISARRLKSSLGGRAMKSSRRHGKYLFAELGASLWLVFHFGMTGDLLYYDRKDDTPDYARLILTFSNWYHLAYISQRLLGRIALIEQTSILKGRASAQTHCLWT
jgi:formamidopyrimidine-DNA glycosylase